MSATTFPSSSEPAPPNRRPLVVTLGRLKPLHGSEDALVATAAASVPLGSKDPADRAILQLGAALGDLRHWQQSDIVKATPATKYGGATIYHTETGERHRILRGDLESVLQAANIDETEASDARSAAAGLRRDGYRSLAVAMAPMTKTGEPGPYVLLGIIPLKARLGKLHVGEHPGDWVYVPLWDAALRTMHWLAVTCIVLLIGTGYMIATPFLAPGSGAPQPYLMGTIRLIHFIAAWVLIATAVVRTADLFLSPYPYARWRSLWPIQNKVEFKSFIDVLRGYLFLRPHQNPTWIGLNPLQAVTYTSVYGLALLMVATGLALFGLYNPSQWPYSWFQWLNWWLGADTVRTIHFIGMWLFMVFVPAHIYLSVRSDTVDRGGAISSMINGGIWLRKNAAVMDAERYTDNDRSPRVSSNTDS